MKQILIFFLLTAITSCSIKEKPEFIRVENIKVSESNPKVITLTADALFKNPNDVGGALKSDGIKVYINNNEMATISAEKFDVPAREEFRIPLKALIPTDSLLSNNSLSGLLGSIFSKKMKVQYKGEIKYKVFGFSHAYNVDETEEVKIKL